MVSYCQLAHLHLSWAVKAVSNHVIMTHNNSLVEIHLLVKTYGFFEFSPHVDEGFLCLIGLFADSLDDLSTIGVLGKVEVLPCFWEGLVDRGLELFD